MAPSTLPLSLPLPLSSLERDENSTCLTTFFYRPLLRGFFYVAGAALVEVFIKTHKQTLNGQNYTVIYVSLRSTTGSLAPYRDATPDDSPGPLASHAETFN